MYLTYDAWLGFGGAEYEDEEAFAEDEAKAEALVDEVTLGRLGRVDWSEWTGEVERATAEAVKALASLQASYDARLRGDGRVTSFSNGVDSVGWEFSEDEEDGPRAALIARLRGILPVELVSGCAGWNHAR